MLLCFVETAHEVVALVALYFDAGMLSVAKAMSPAVAGGQGYLVFLDIGQQTLKLL